MILHLPSFFSGLAVMFGALVAGALTHWSVPLWLIFVGGAIVVYVSLRRGYRRGRGRASRQLRQDGPPDIECIP